MFTLTAAHWYAFAASFVVFALVVVWALLHVRKSKRIKSLAEELEAGPPDYGSVGLVELGKEHPEAVEKLREYRDGIPVGELRPVAKYELKVNEETVAKVEDFEVVPRYEVTEEAAARMYGSSVEVGLAMETDDPPGLLKATQETSAALRGMADELDKLVVELEEDLEKRDKGGDDV